MRHCFTATIAAALVATSAQAAVTDVVWRLVGSAPSASIPGLPTHTGSPEADAFQGAIWASMSRYTFDLILQGDAGQRISGINLGDSNFPNAAPFALYTNGSVFNHSFGGDVRSATEFPPFNAMAYDTYVDLGGGVATPVISFVSPADLNANGTTDKAIRANWFTDDDASLDGNGEMRIMRITVGFEHGFDPWLWNSGAYLGTPDFGPDVGDSPTSMLRVVLFDGSSVDLVIGDAVQPLSPTPSATALLGIAGAAGMRRRRAQ